MSFTQNYLHSRDRGKIKIISEFIVYTKRLQYHTLYS